MSPLTCAYSHHIYDVVKSMYYVIAIIIVLVSIDFWLTLLIPIPCVHIATISNCVDFQDVAVVVNTIIHIFCSPFVNLLIYVVIGAIIGAIPIDLVQNKLMPCSLSPRLFSLAFH